MKRRLVMVIFAMVLLTAPVTVYAADSNSQLSQSSVPVNGCLKLQPGVYFTLYSILPQFQAAKISAIQLEELVPRFGAGIAKASTNVVASEEETAEIVTEKPATTSSAITPSAFDSLGAFEKRVVDLVNQERAKAGLAALKVNLRLSEMAETKAADLRDNHYFNHTSPTYGTPFDMMRSFGIGYTAAGENIAKGQETPEEVVNCWMNSPGHKANILSSKYTEIGVGYLTDSEGTGYWVQEFIRP